MEFEWDENKRLANISKHGVDFWDALEVFDDQNRIEKMDERLDYGELRFQIIGRMKNETILFIVKTNRATKIRIISARPANKKEITEYDKGV